jgi:hypothetical protein
MNSYVSRYSAACGSLSLNQASVASSAFKLFHRVGFAFFLRQVFFVEINKLDHLPPISIISQTISTLKRTYIYLTGRPPATSLNKSVTACLHVSEANTDGYASHRF